MLEPNQPPASRASEWCFFPLTVLTSSHISPSYFEVCVESHVVLCDSLWHCREDVCFIATHTVTPSVLQSIRHAVVRFLARYVGLCALLCSVTILSICLPDTRLCLQQTVEHLGLRQYCDTSVPVRCTCRRRSLVTQWGAPPGRRAIIRPGDAVSLDVLERGLGCGGETVVECSFRGDISCFWRQHSSSSYTKRF